MTLALCAPKNFGPMTRPCHRLLVATTMNQVSLMESATLTNKDVEYIVPSFKRFQVSEVGNTDFLDMAYDVQRLALHIQTDTAVSVRIVATILLLHDKMSVLVQNLVAVEAWRVFILQDKLLPRED